MKKQNFDQGWEFSEAWGLMAMFSREPWQPVNLPHDAMIGKPRAADNTGGAHVGYFPGGVANYRKKFLAPVEWEGESVQLEFEGVYMHAEISINNQLVQRQPYGYSSFVVDLTPYLLYGQENTINVVANNTAQPNSRWYTGAGIYRHVWLRVGGAVHIQPWGVFVTTPVVGADLSVVQASTELAGLDSLEGAVVRSTLLDADGVEVARAEYATRISPVQQTLLVNAAKLWSVEEPTLYTLRSEVLVGGSVVDTESTTFGIRSLAMDAENGFRLNGAPMKLKGGCIHHDHGPLGAASFDRAEERKVELLKAAGYNAIRCAHNPPAPALLDACDRLGMLVIDETFDAWTAAKTPNDYHLHFQEWWQRDTEAMVKRDRNHPSVIIWSIGNEIIEALGSPAGATLAQQQADFVRALDNSRPVTSALIFDVFALMAADNINNAFEPTPVAADPQKDRWALATAPFCKALDVVGYNYLVQRYAVDGEKFPNRVIIGTETWGHRSYDFWTETARLPHVLGDFLWIAIDYIGEAGFGAFTLDDKVTMGAPYPYHLYGCGDFDLCGVKRPQSYYREQLWGVRTDPFIAVLPPELFGKKLAFTPWAWEPVLDAWTFPGQEGESVQVDVYAIDDEVALLINGEAVGRKPAGAAVKNKATFEVAYQPGTIEAIGYTGGQETGRFQLVTASAPARLHLAADRDVIPADTGSIAYVEIAVLDRNGTLVKHGAPEITVTVGGAGELLAIGTGNPLSEEPYVGNQRSAHHGRLLAVVRSNGEPGAITLTAHTEGLPDVQIELQAK
ncbi:MAG: glycoside hydrolase family 2 protein [Caldilineaceae bacterium]|jgi:beta-galactosidase|nr:glycoside hydrolase family 2 protein [Caldilineaceae bacterium]